MPKDIKSKQSTEEVEEILVEDIFNGINFVDEFTEQDIRNLNLEEYESSGEYTYDLLKEEKRRGKSVIITNDIKESTSDVNAQESNQETTVVESTSKSNKIDVEEQSSTNPIQQTDINLNPVFTYKENIDLLTEEVAELSDLIRILSKEFNDLNNKTDNLITKNDDFKVKFTNVSDQFYEMSDQFYEMSDLFYVMSDKFYEVFDQDNVSFKKSNLNKIGFLMQVILCILLILLLVQEFAILKMLQEHFLWEKNALLLSMIPTIFKIISLALL